MPDTTNPEVTPTPTSQPMVTEVKVSPQKPATKEEPVTLTFVFDEEVQLQNEGILINGVEDLTSEGYDLTDAVYTLNPDDGSYMMEFVLTPNDNMPASENIVMEFEVLAENYKSVATEETGANKAKAWITYGNAVVTAGDTDKCCCCPTPEPEAPFERPSEDCSTITTFVPCDTRIPTITSGHYVYEDDMPHFHYDVGSIEDAEAYFGKEQQKITHRKEDNTFFTEQANFVVNQPNVNPPFPSVHLSRTIDDIPEGEALKVSVENSTIEDPVTGETMPVA